MKKYIPEAMVIVLILICVALLFKNRPPVCKCVIQIPIQEYTMYSDGTFDSKTDSICSSYVTGDGSVIVRKFNQ